MEEPLKLSDYNQRFYFMFFDGRQAVVPLNPRIGSLKVQNIVFDIKTDGTSSQKATNVPIREVDFSKDEEDAKTIPIYGHGVRGVYTETDFSKLALSVASSPAGLARPLLTFAPCIPSSVTDCASSTEIEDFLTEHRMVYMLTENFVELDEINLLMRLYSKFFIHLWS